MRRPSMKTFLLTLLVVIAIVIPIYTIHYFLSTRTVVIRATNITSFLVSTGKSSKGNKTYPATTTSIRINNDQEYTLTYLATSDYKNGTQTIHATDQTVTINPDYSTDKLNALLSPQLETINNTIRQISTVIDSLYTIDKGNLSNYGDWYFTTLTYKGSIDDENSDTLVVGLQKHNGTWVVTLPPDIIFTTVAYPNVSRDFINAANEYQKNNVTPREELYFR